MAIEVIKFTYISQYGMHIAKMSIDVEIKVKKVIYTVVHNTTNQQKQIFFDSFINVYYV